MSPLHTSVSAHALTSRLLRKARTVLVASLLLALVGIPTPASRAAIGGAGPASSSPSSNVRPAGTIVEYKLPSAVSTPSGITKGPDGNVWFTTEHGGTIGKITPSGAVELFSVAPAGSSLGGIATGPDESIWFTDYTDARVGRISAAGTGVTLFPVAGTPGLAGIAGGADGNSWFSEAQASTVGRLSTSGSGLTGFPTSTAGAWPHGLGPGPDGNIWFAEIKADKIGRITPAGSVSEWLLPTAKAEPRVVTTGADGNIWFTEFAGNKIGRVAPTGTITEFPVPTSSSSPVGIAQGQDGYVWFTEQAGNKIGRISMAGSITEFPLPTLAAQPDKITLGADGNLWFTERSSNKIGMIVSGPPSSLAPKNTIAPAVSGAPAQGQTLRATQGSWSGLPIPSVSYQWLRCDQTGLNCAAIPGANATTYTATTVDVGARVGVQVRATSSAGAESVNSAIVAAIAGPPVAGSPSIAGAPVEGQMLTAVPGIWGGYPVPALSFQWLRCDASGGVCVSIPGATGSAYIPGTADVGGSLEVSVTGVNASGTATSSSVATSVVGEPPEAPVAAVPEVSGVAGEGLTMTAVPGVWGGYPAPELSFQWLRCDVLGGGCVPIAGATASAYVPGAADVGGTLKVSVTGINASGTAVAASGAGAVVAGAPVAAAPVLAGSPVEGQMLTVAPGIWGGYPIPALSYQWLRCDQFGGGCAPIEGANGSSYVLGAADVGGTLEASVTGANASGEVTSSSAPTSVVGQHVEAPVAAVPTVTGVVAEGQTLVASPGVWGGVPAPELSYRWLRCDLLGGGCAPIAGATGSAYVPGAADVGGTLEVSVTGTNAGGAAVASSGVGAVVSGSPVSRCAGDLGRAG